MIKIESNPVIARLLKRKTCATLILTNCESLPIGIIEKISDLAFMTNLVNDLKDFICVVPLGNEFTKLWINLLDFSSFSKIEEIN